MDKQQQLAMVKKVREASTNNVNGSTLQPSYTPQVKQESRMIPTSYEDAPVTVHIPDRELAAPLPVFVNFHGGGFVMGNPKMDDPWCSVIADRAECVVVNVDYLLAPEYPFPVPVYQSYEVVKWIAEHATELNIDATRIAVGGHSAGGNLAAAICLLNKERGNELNIVYQVIDYAPLDLDTDPAQKPQFSEAIPNDISRIFNACYLEHPEDGRNPLASPVFAPSLTGLPSALVITAERDSLAAETVGYAKQLEEAGVTVTAKQYAGAAHGFTHNGDLAVAEDAWHLMSDKLKEAFTAKQ
ncbi:Versiconal hemiacetal acetate esterase [Paenibacillus nuruki]|uniref:Versiconal hemiacetal acetate esterase n=1 Tax=Paenibacillus nuruki TaxID=1886670 RepID=A0A1E3L6Z5_9BACL|nr:alpha/beta hydrolase [Paenibacillus nuruki]ODP29539.1 Versiconal hemiacetal acetate esterase [Paenibacillus nuruki]